VIPLPLELEKRYLPVHISNEPPESQNAQFKIALKYINDFKSDT
jgi:hypothetical protein